MPADGTQTQLMSVIEGIVLGQPLTVSQSHQAAGRHAARPVARTLLEEGDNPLGLIVTLEAWGGITITDSWLPERPCVQIDEDTACEIASLILKTFGRGAK